ncbi:MAG TPA: hypothetical protein VIT62_03595 [Lysobacter sp.]
MSHPFDEPLTPEERAMADRLARLGPHDGPSPALDAKILAAAHAAVAPRKNRRWLALSGVPATLVTGAGMAAVLALAVGVVWQMRPSAPAPQAPRGEADDFGFVTAQVIERAEPRPAPPPPPSADAPAPEHALRPPAMPRREPAAPGGNAAMTARTHAPVMPSPPEHYLDEAADPSHGHAAPAMETAAAAASMRGDSAPLASSPAPASVPAPAPAAAEAEYRERAAAQAESAQRKAVAKEVDERRQLRSQGYTSAMPAAATVASDAVATDAADSAGSATLDRIEVTGSRISAADLPVRDDRNLEPAQWLQRIRERRDGGDLDGARESLVLFRKAYPRVRLPDDLRTLPASPR